MKNENGFFDKITLIISIVCVIIIAIVGTVFLKIENANNSKIIRSEEHEEIESHIDKVFADTSGNDNKYEDLYELININTASKNELMSLDGIGEKRAEAIIEYRSSHPFKTTSEITEVYGIGKNIYNNIKNKICVE